MPAALRTLSFWLGIGGIVLMHASPTLPTMVTLPCGAVLLGLLRACARREGRQVAEAHLLDLDRYAYRGAALRGAPR